VTNDASFVQFGVSCGIIPSMGKPKVYLDNCCFNRPFDDQSQLLVRLETEAVLFIQDEIKSGNLELIWSSILDFENDANPFTTRRDAIRIWRKRSLAVIRPNAEVKEIAKALQVRNIHLKDSLHIASAVVSQCHFLITTDGKMLNKPVDEIAIVNPIRFIQEYEAFKNMRRD